MAQPTQRFSLLPRTRSAIWSSLGIGIYLVSLYLTFRAAQPSPPDPAQETEKAAPAPAPAGPDGVPVAGGGTAGTTVLAGGQAAPVRAAAAISAGGAGAAVKAAGRIDNRPAFYIALGGFVVMLACLGMRSVGRFAGVLITERNVMSLSRFQTALWTGIILSGLVAITFAQIKGGVDMKLSIPTELWALMGISTASLVGTPLILSNKRGAAEQAASEPNAVVYRNDSAREAAFGDLIEGDERANASTVDLSKVQMFAFTIVSLAVYWAALLHVLRDFQATAALPVPTDGMLALLGVSHAGYLTYKAVNHSGPSPSAPPAGDGTGGTGGTGGTDGTGTTAQGGAAGGGSGSGG
jgi:hypothetical protein